MKPIVNADVEKYLLEVLPRRDKVLVEMEKLAKRNDIPIIGPAVGRLLYLLATPARRQNARARWWFSGLPSE